MNTDLLNRWPHIAVIGAGEVGSRHLQGLSGINRPVEISVIDPNQGSIDVAKRRFNEQSSNQFERKVYYKKSLTELDSQVDIVIIATNADVRRKVVEQLMEQVPVKYLILEKVAFQSIESFEFVIQLLNKHKAKAWVNCVRRMYPFYIKLREELRKEERIYIDMDLGPSSGGESGLACNTIHILDLFSYLTREKTIALDVSGLDNKIYPTRRVNYVEFSGCLLATTARGDHLRIIHERGVDRPSIHTISSEHCRYIIFQLMGMLYRQDAKSEWKIKEQQFVMPLQSELTSHIVQQILDSGESNLCALEESYMLHRPMLMGFNSHLQGITGREYSDCPIT